MHAGLCVQIKWIKCELWTRNKDRWLHQSNQYRETETSDPFALFWYCTRSRTLMQPSQASPSAASCSIGSRHVMWRSRAWRIPLRFRAMERPPPHHTTISKQARQPHYWRFFCGSPYGHLRKPQGDTWGLPAASEHGQPSPPHSHSQPPSRCSAWPGVLLLLCCAVRVYAIEQLAQQVRGRVVNFARSNIYRSAGSGLSFS